jgi:hypothetical protein
VEKWENFGKFEQKGENLVENLGILWKNGKIL